MAVALALDGCAARMEDALETDAPPLWKRLAGIIPAPCDLTPGVVTYQRSGVHG